MSDAVIQVEHLSKRYRLGQTPTLRERLASLGGFIQNGNSRPSQSDNDLWALRDVSFQVNTGEVLGLIGRNGSGKSTLLKILSRITAPTGGTAKIHGHVGSLLEVGTGFHPELSGRENIYLNGAILGMRRKEITKHFEEIVEFADVHKFLDTPIKRYSSGMHVRLAFAVAAHLKPKILFIDEVLAVGDSAFQQKCLGKMTDVAQQGKTIVFVSHNMSAISRLCQKTVWLEAGQVKQIGPTIDVVQSYLTANIRGVASVQFPVDPDKEGQITEIDVLDSNFEPNGQILAGLPFTIRMKYRLSRTCKHYRAGITISLSDGLEIYNSSSSDTNGVLLTSKPGEYTSYLTIPPALLNTGRYLVSCSIGQPSVRTIDYHQNVVGFDVVGSSRDEQWAGIIGLTLPWKHAACA